MIEMTETPTAASAEIARPMFSGVAPCCARPILFSGPMIRAILAGEKTQTRRIVKNRDRLPIGELFDLTPSLGYRASEGSIWAGFISGKSQFQEYFKCPYGQPGDSLWVREAFRIFDRFHECDHLDACSCPKTGTPIYRAGEKCDDEYKWKPSIHMPRLASRITLGITDIRVERLQQISDEDAIAEGIECVGGEYSCCPWRNYRKGQAGEMNLHCSSPDRSYMTLWESINGPGSWKENPWVWVVSFRVV